MFVDVVYDTDICPSHFVNEYGDVWQIEDVIAVYPKNAVAIKDAFVVMKERHPGHGVVMLDGVTAFLLVASMGDIQQLPAEWMKLTFDPK